MCTADISDAGDTETLSGDTNNNDNCDGNITTVIHIHDSCEGDTRMEYDRVSLEDWQKQQPLSILQLDTADRVVLRVAGNNAS